MLNIDIAVQLLSFCFSPNCFIFNNAFYHQINGTPMGSPSTVRIAEIAMQYIEVKNNSYFGTDKILRWRRYVDDVFILTKNEYINDSSAKANSICPLRDPEPNNFLMLQQNLLSPPPFLILFLIYSFFVK